MKTLDANARIDLVKRVRTEFRPHFFMRCLEVAYRVIPCCENCEHNLQGTCTAPQLTFQDDMPFSGLSIKDKENLCIQWSPSPASIISAMKHIYKSDRLNPKPNTKPNTKSDPAYSVEELSEQIRMFYSGETTAAAAAEELKMGLSTFYQKAKKTQFYEPQKSESAYSVEELSEQIRMFHSGETTAAAAAEELKMGLSTFYHKVKKDEISRKKGTT